MGILGRNKKNKDTVFVYDESNNQYKAEINEIEFVCDSMNSDYENRARELVEHTMNSLHIIEMEFDGIFTAFYNS